jgi:hypothetical protein
MDSRDVAVKFLQRKSKQVALTVEIQPLRICPQRLRQRGARKGGVDLTLLGCVRIVGDATDFRSDGDGTDAL